MSLQSRHATPSDSSAAVDALMAGLVHPHKPAIERLRRTIINSDPAIVEGVKWNAPSFRTHEYFATAHLRAKTGIALILHRGAKARALPEGAMSINDPDALLQWRGPDRAQVVFSDTADVQRRSDALQALVRQWIALV